MPGQILLNAFDMNTPSHQSNGLWRHPRDQRHRYTSMAYWQELARTLERGLFDGIFLADVTGIYDVYGGSPATALRAATQVPTNDPFTIVPVMAAVTEHLGFGVTGAGEARGLSALWSTGRRAGLDLGLDRRRHVETGSAGPYRRDGCRRHSLTCVFLVRADGR